MNFNGFNWSNTTFCGRHLRITVDRTSETFSKVRVQKWFRGKLYPVTCLSRGFRGTVKGVESQDRAMQYAEELWKALKH